MEPEEQIKNIIAQVREIAQLSRGFNLRGKQKHSEAFLSKYSSMRDSIHAYDGDFSSDISYMVKSLPKPIELKESFDKADKGIKSNSWLFYITFFVFGAAAAYGVVVLFEGVELNGKLVGVIGVLVALAASFIQYLYRSRHDRHEEKFELLTVVSTELYVLLKEEYET